MYSGKVRNWFDSSCGTGYGFIIPDQGGEDAFVHRQHVVNAYHLISGDTVTYDMEVNPMRRSIMQTKSLNLAAAPTGQCVCVG